MDTIAGVSFPKGGVRALPQALADAAADAGAEFRYGTTVTGLERSGGRVRALRTVPTGEPSADGDRLAADAVVLTCDLPVSYGLLGRTPRRVVPMRWSPSAFVWHAGVPRPAPASVTTPSRSATPGRARSTRSSPRAG